MDFIMIQHIAIKPALLIQSLVEINVNLKDLLNFLM